MNKLLKEAMVPGIIAGLVFIFVGFILGGSAMFFYKIDIHNNMITKYGECITGNNKISLDLARCRTEATEDLLDITDELVICKEAIMEMAKEEAARMR